MAHGTYFMINPDNEIFVMQVLDKAYSNCYAIIEVQDDYIVVTRSKQGSPYTPDYVVPISQIRIAKPSEAH
jgi:hypothetical protein